MKQKQRHKKPMSKKKKIALIISGLLFLFVSVFGLAFLYELGQINKATSKISTTTSTAQTRKQVAEGKPIALLIEGLDNGAVGRAAGVGNTDTLMLVTINPHTKTTSFTGIARDTLSQITDSQGNTQYIKINAAYAMGGPTKTVDQVNELLGINIDYYVTVNMGLLIQAVNDVGGITVNSPLDFSYGGYTFHKGKQKIYGKAALQYSRMRDDDPRGDYGRQLRQQQVLQAVIAQVLHKHDLGLINQLLKDGSQYIRTNMPLDNVTDLYQAYEPASKHIIHDQLKGLNATIDGLSYQTAPDSEINRLSKTINERLGRSYTPVVNNETKLNAMQTNYDGINNVYFSLPNN